MCCVCSCKLVHVLTAVHCVFGSISLLFPSLSLHATRDAFCKLLGSALSPLCCGVSYLTAQSAPGTAAIAAVRDRFDLSAQPCSHESGGDLAIVEG